MKARTTGKQDLVQPNAENRYKVTRADLPLSCPMPGMSLWNSHPKVYLPVQKTGAAKCPYCGAEFMTLNGDTALTITNYYDVPQRVILGKYAKSGLRKEQMHEYMRRLDVIMESQRAYLKPDLTLPILAESVGCSVNHLSQVINSGFAMSFFDYINNYRIRRAKEILLQIDSQNSAILNVAFSVGFNSNSAFYAAFKKHAGVTPAAFRRSHNKSTH